MSTTRVSDQYAIQVWFRGFELSNLISELEWHSVHEYGGCRV